MKRIFAFIFALLFMFGCSTGIVNNDPCKDKKRLAKAICKVRNR